MYIGLQSVSILATARLYTAQHEGPLPSESPKPLRNLTTTEENLESTSAEDVLVISFALQSSVTTPRDLAL